MEGLVMVLMLTVVGLTYLLFDSYKKYDDARQLTGRDLWLIEERIKLMSPRDFEVFICSLFRMLGYRAELTPPTNDMGRDVILQDKNGEYTFIECKHWKDCIDRNISENDGQYHDIDERVGYATPIGRPIAQKLKGSMDYGFDGKKAVNKGIIMTTTRFTNECREYCKAMNIEMYELEDIMKLVEKVGTEKLYVAVGIKRDGRYI